jgi:hypothetical protein
LSPQPDSTGSHDAETAGRERKPQRERGAKFTKLQISNFVCKAPTQKPESNEASQANVLLF